jgi:hypothetical protein
MVEVLIADVALLGLHWLVLGLTFHLSLKYIKSLSFKDELSGNLETRVVGLIVELMKASEFPRKGDSDYLSSIGDLLHFVLDSRGHLPLSYSIR